MARSGATRTRGRIASTPWTWPAIAGRPWAAAQRRLPSMMMATWRGWSRAASASDLHHFRFLALGSGVDRLDEAIMDALQPIKLATFFILGEVALAERLLQLVGRFPPV